MVYNYKQEVEKEVEQPQLTTGLEEEVETKETAQMKVVNILQKELEEQRKSNLLKDEQIKSLMEMLKQTQCMLDQEQKLNAINAKRILQLEESKENRKEKKRKSIFNFFKRNVVEE